MLTLNSPLTDQEKQKLNSKIDKTTGCWFWTSTKCTKGYGVIQFRGRQWKAHRLIYFMEFGRLPQLVSDHTCRVRHCVNPHHIDMTTLIENVMRGESPQAQNALKTKCPKGHEYKIRRNSHMAKGFQRYCPTCNRLSSHGAQE